MNTFTANIQREWLARILAGSKKIEYRSATNYWLGRLQKVGPPPFYLRLINGMKSDSPEGLVIVDDVDIELVAGEIRLHLGKVVSTSRWDDRWTTQYPAIPARLSVPETPPVAGDVSIILEVDPSVVAELHPPGAHAFDLAVDVELGSQLIDYGPEPFFVRLSAPKSQATVLAYEIIWRCFEDRARFHVLTPNSVRDTA